MTEPEGVGASYERRMKEIRVELETLGHEGYPSEHDALEDLLDQLSEDMESTNFGPTRKLMAEWIECIEGW